MDAFTRLAQQQPVIFVHLVSALAALVLGGFILSRRKGTINHRVFGWTWVMLMAVTAISSAFIHGGNLPNLAGFSPIHVLTVFVALLLPLGVRFVRRGNVNGHRKTMTNLYIGACLIAGAFTLLPGRLLGDLVWKDWLGVLT
jgi:uncharacterized membrane protein